MFHTRIALKLFKAAIGSGEWLPMACMPLLPPPTFFFGPCRSPLPQSGSVLLAEPLGTPELSRARVFCARWLLAPEPSRLPPLLAEAFVLQLPCWHLP